MTQSEDPPRVEPLPNPERGEQAAGLTAPQTAARGLGDGDRADRPAVVREVGGRDGPEPTRFGDWELRGRCIDF
jgi:hypothetical protein